VGEGKLTADQRQEALAQRVAELSGEGWRVETLMDFQAILVKGHRPNHVLHLLLSVATFGVWLLFWPAVAMDGGEERVVLTVDETGAIRLR